ncbi:Callose synthase 5, partial [Linum grandiflorum]
MANQLHGMLAGNDNIVTGENIKPSYAGDDEAFLRKVVTPIYRVIAKEASKSGNGTASSTEWCNYDDLNEYFWFQFAEIIKEREQQFWHLRGSKEDAEKVATSVFWMIDKILLQLMIIYAWSGVAIQNILRRDVLYYLSSIFITAAFLRLLQSILDLVLNFPGYHRWKFTDVLRSILKIIVETLSCLHLLSEHLKIKWLVLQMRMTFHRTVKSIPPIYLLLYELWVCLDNDFSRCQVSANKGSEAAKFAQLWNEVITSFREDLISDRKGYTTEIDNIVKGFSLTCFNIEVANSFFKGDGFVTNPYSAKYGSPLQIKGLRLMETICADEYMKCAIIECCEFFKQVLNILVVGGNEK